MRRICDASSAPLQKYAVRYTGDEAIPEFTEKQKFLNTIYEEAVERADTLGIDCTPQEIVEFMPASVGRF